MTTVPQSVNAHGGTTLRVQGGNKTHTVYSLIRDGKYNVSLTKPLPRSPPNLTLPNRLQSTF
jgi:hypothetical protein